MAQEEFQQQIPSSIVLPPEDLSSLTDEELWNFLSDFELYLRPNGGPVVCSITGVMYSEEDWKEMERKTEAELDARAAVHPRSVEEWQDTPRPILATVEQHPPM